MKKKVLLMSLCLLLITAGIFAQGAEDKSYRINGISTAEDIGGVDVSGVDGVGGQLEFVNHNSFPVTVIYEAAYSVNDKVTGTVVLDKGATKKISVKCADGGCRWGFERYTLIVRKLSK